MKRGWKMIGWMGVLGSCLAMAACYSTSPRRSRAAATAKLAEAVPPVVERTGGAPAASGTAPATGGAYRDPVQRATLREKALGVLVAVAANGLPEERANALEALASSPARLYPLLDTALADPNVGVRSVAAMAVGRAKLEAAAEKVYPLLSDSSPQARAAGMFALKRCGRSVDLTPMAAMLADADLRVRAQTAFLLGELGESSAVGLLREAGRESVAKYPPGEVRMLDLQIAEARVKLGDDVPLQEIRAALFPGKAEDLEAAALACQIVGQVRDKTAVNRLIVLTALQDDSKQFMPAEVRLAAAAALARMGQRQGSYLAEQYRASSKDALRSQAAFVYGETLQVENLPMLSEMMNDQVGRVRVAAAAAIVKITEAAGDTVSGVGQ